MTNAEQREAARLAIYKAKKDCRTNVRQPSILLPI